MGPAVGPGVCLCELAKGREGWGMRRLHGKKWLAGPEASKPAHWATSGIEVVVVVGGVCPRRKTGQGAVGPARMEGVGSSRTAPGDPQDTSAFVPSRGGD